MRLWTPHLIAPFFWFDADDDDTALTATWYSKAPHLGYPRSAGQRMSVDARAIREDGGANYNNHKVYNLADTADMQGTAGAFITDKAYNKAEQLSYFAVGDVHRTGLSAIPVLMSIFNGSTVYMDLRLRATDSTTTVLTVGGRRLSGDTYQSLTATRSGISTTSPSVYSGIFDYTNAQLYAGIDGIYTPRSGGFQTAGLPETTTRTLRVGNFTESNPAPDAIAELLGVYGIPTVEQRQALEGYLAHKYGINDQLQASHPYRNFPPTVFDDGTPMGILQAISGECTVLDDGPADRVIACSATTLKFLAEATPDSEGAWTMAIPVGDYYLTYFSTECQPVTHGPYTMSAP
jgi:hypothetical protein